MAGRAPVLVAADPAHPRLDAPGRAPQAGQLRGVLRAMVDDDRREAEASEFAEDRPAPDPILQLVQCLALGGDE